MKVSAGTTTLQIRGIHHFNQRNDNKNNYSTLKLSALGDLARIRNPIGTYLLFWPCVWGSAMGAHIQGVSSLDPVLYGKFALGALVMRGAGCTINDLWDRNIDRQVTRTKSRPLASGAVSVNEAVAFLALQLGVGLGVLVSFDPPTILLASASLLPVAAYPAMKRYTNFPQLFLGLTINWGVLVGHCQLGTLLHPSVPFMYLSAVLWTVVYDTIYAHQDTKDDAMLGVGSSALTLGEKTPVVLGALVGLSTLCMGLSGYLAGVAPSFYVLSVLAPGAFQIHQLWTLDMKNPKDCMDKFKAHGSIAALVGLGILIQ